MVFMEELRSLKLKIGAPVPESVLSAPGEARPPELPVVNPKPVATPVSKPKPTVSAKTTPLSDEEALAEFNALQDRNGKPHGKYVHYDSRTDSYNWIGPTKGRTTSRPGKIIFSRSSIDAEATRQK
jgi:hypothetical protein